MGTVIDHVTIRVGDLPTSSRCYRRAFELLDFGGNASDGGDFLEWNDFSISAETPERPATRRLHVGFQAISREQVDRWWQEMTAAGYEDDGPPGPRPIYGPDYYGGFVLDPDGNSIEAVHNRPRSDDGRVIDHLWIRVRSRPESQRFYETFAPVIGYDVRPLPDRAQIRTSGASFSVLEGEPTENVHLAFAAADRATVDAFHRTGLEAGFSSLGEPGERPQYHPGYYGAYLADPDGHNIEAVFHGR
jgi:catechol 2,3-dioxygenase-like lactoylglutathione lyase family enzyme